MNTLQSEFQRRPLTGREVTLHVMLGTAGAVILFVTWGLWLLTSPTSAVPL